MIKLVVKLSLVLVVAAILLSSCGDKNNDPTPTPSAPTQTKTQLLTAKNWKVTAATATVPPSPIPVDVFSTLYDPCDQDDLVKFNTGGTGTKDAGATKCDPLDNQTTPFTWAFNAGETTITITDNSVTPADVITFTIVTLNATTLSGTTTTDIGGGTMATITQTFTAQ